MELLNLKYIDIIDFKCFKNFRLESIGQVNLISGKNNIGKTAFLEACYVSTSATHVNSFVYSLISKKLMRENINLLEKTISTPINFKKLSIEYLEFIKIYKSISNLNSVEYKFIYQDGKKEYFFRFLDKEIKINSNEFSLDFTEGSTIGYIDNFGLSDDELIEIYKAIQRQDRESYLNELIKKFDNSIDGFKIIGDKPQCKVDGEYYDLVEFGDGLKHYISIICALYANENSQLFIDEIDSDIHYTQLEKIWNIIFDVSEKVNCQVFATTHSKECIEAFNMTNKHDNGVYFEFYKNKNGEIKASKRDKSQLEYALKHAGRIRGEK